MKDAAAKPENTPLLQSERLHYIDNLKALIILFLVPLHTCEAFHVEHTFFIDGADHMFPTMIYAFLITFMMSVLFVFAGMSAVYSLKRRGTKGFFLNRCKKLLLPFAISLVTLLPSVAWFILKNHTDFDGTFFDAYIFFFTHVTDLYGFDGAFAPQHLWFVLYLFIIQLICFPLILFYDRLCAPFIRLHFDTRWICTLIVLIFAVNYGPSDESFARFLLYYVFGFMMAENQSFNEYLDKRWKVILATGIAFNIVVMFLFVRIKRGDIFTVAYCWRRAIWACANVLMTLGVIGMGKALLNRESRRFRFFVRESFLIYIIHMPVLFIAAYFTVTYVNVHYLLQMLIIIATSFIGTLALVNVIRIGRKALKR